MRAILMIAWTLVSMAGSGCVWRPGMAPAYNSNVRAMCKQLYSEHVSALCVFGQENRDLVWS